MSKLAQRLERLEQKTDPRWNPLLIVPDDQWDNLEEYLSKQPPPPPGCGFLVLPEECSVDTWEETAKAEMAEMRRQLDLTND